MKIIQPQFFLKEQQSQFEIVILWRIDLVIFVWLRLI